MKKKAFIVFLCAILLIGTSTMFVSADDSFDAIPTLQTFYLDGEEVDIEAYNINGNNYVKLRDVGRLVDFGVTYIEEDNSVQIDSEARYIEEGATVPATSDLTKAGYSIFADTMVEMSWPEVKAAADRGAVVLLPTGVIEEHGPHMGIGVDTYGAWLRSKLLKDELESRGIEAIIAPPMYWGVNVFTAAWEGSFVTRESTTTALMTDILNSLASWGFEDVYIVNHHGNRNHSFAMMEGLKIAKEESGINTYYLLNGEDAKAWGVAQEEYILIPEASGVSYGGIVEGSASPYVDPHAGTYETSMMAHYFPNDVDTEMAKKYGDSKITAEGFAKVRGSAEVAMEMAPWGYIGDPSAYDTEYGRSIYEDEASKNADVVVAELNGTYKAPTA
ncbi:MAG: creatininase family protein [Oscillospiraceae bacterium]|nr:creatininase family protein [Oscillospiraceae bacterium]